MKQLFVSFDDDPNDPTYQEASVCLLVKADDDESSLLNPIVGDEKAEAVKLIPKTEKQLRAYAKMMGWEVKVKAKTLILVTDIPLGG